MFIVQVIATMRALSFDLVLPAVGYGHGFHDDALGDFEFGGHRGHLAFARDTKRVFLSGSCHGLSWGDGDVRVSH